MSNKQFYEFGPFRLDPAERGLSRDGEQISLTPKSFDLLLMLVERHGTLVSKAEMMAGLWPDTAVEEGNLTWNVSAVRKALSDESNTTYIETVPKFGYRFVAPVRAVQPPSQGIAPLAASGEPIQDTPTPVSASPPRPRRLGLWLGAVAMVALAAAAFTYPRPVTPALVERDWVLIAAIDNRTDQPDFDDVLAEVVAVQFDQSPYFRVYSRDRLDEQLTLMRRQPGERITEAIARDICERAGIKAFVTGSIDKVGPDYVITLVATNAADGDALSRSQHTVGDVPAVLRALVTASSSIRRDLGESLRSIQTFSVRADVATTSSLPALRAFREGLQLMAADQTPKAVPFFQRAVELDPDFALAYGRLAAAYANLQDRRRSEWAAREAFLRRDRVSERERHEIAARYYRDVTGEVSQAVASMEVGARLFPDDARLQNLLQILLRDIGRIRDAVTYGERAVQLAPQSPTYRTNLLGGYIRTGDLGRARELRDRTERDGLDTPGARRQFRLLAVHSDDSAAIAREDEWQKSRRVDAAQLSDFVPSQMAVAGRLADARQHYRDLIRRSDARGRAALATEFLARLTLAESLLDPDRAVASTTELLARDPSRYQAAEGAFALAAAKGDLSYIRALVDQYPQDELLTRLWLPMSQAVAEIRAGRSASAVPLLRALEAFDLGDFAALRPSYFLGQALLATGAAADARTAFDRIVRHRGVVSSNPLFALAHLGLARTATLAGLKTEAVVAYERFFAMWNDADAALPVMRAARSEYARLKP